VPDPDRSDPEIIDFCATQSWAMIVALSRFGTFTGIRTIRSAALNSALAQAITDQVFPSPGYLDVLRFRLHQPVPDLRPGRDEIQRPGLP
jgi:hypothetical protein